MLSLRVGIDRRILVNFRIDGDALGPVFPVPFTTRTADDYAIGGICLLRLADVRPSGLPVAVGSSSENAAHRTGVHWDDDGAQRDGVFVLRRDTDSRLTALVPDRSFGNHHHADFTVEEGAGRCDVSVQSCELLRTEPVPGRRRDLRQRPADGEHRPRVAQRGGYLSDSTSVAPATPPSLLAGHC